MKKVIFAFISFAFLLVTVAMAQVQTTDEVAGKSAFISGMEAFENEQYEVARDYLLQAHQTIGGASGITFALADTYLMLGDLKNAIQYGKKAVAGEPANKWYRFKLAEIYRTAGKNEATLSELTTLLEYHPTDFEALYLLANTYENYGEFLKANHVFDRILRLTGPDINVYLSKLQNYEKLGMADSTLAVLEKIREADPDNLHTLNLLGEYYSKSGYGGKARSILDEALNRNPRDPQTLINMAGIYLEEENWAEAGSLLCNFVADSLVNVEEKFRISQYLYTQFQQRPDNEELITEAIKIFDAFTSNEPKFGPAFKLSGQFFAEIGKQEKALSHLVRATELSPYDDMAWRQRIQILISQNQLQQAIEVGKKADTYIPDDAFILFFIGSAYMLQENLENAKIWLEKATHAPARRPLKSLIYNSLADVHAAQNNSETAIKNYELALRYDPENQNARNNYAAHLAKEEVSLEKAEELILEALEHDPDNAVFLGTAGRIYYKMEQFEKAQEYLKASVKTGEAGSDVLEYLGDVYEMLNNLDEAKKWWKRAFEMDSTKTHLQTKL